MPYPLSKLSEEISVDNMLKTTKHISQFDRLSGSEEERESFLYLKNRLEEYGAKTTLIHHDAFISLPLESSIVLNGKKIFSRPASMSAKTPQDGLFGELVYLSRLSEASTKICSGKVIALNGRANYNNVKKAINLGASALVCIQENRINECIASGAWGSPTRDSFAMLPNIPVISVEKADFLNVLGKSDTASIRMDVEMDTGWRKIPLLLAEVFAEKQTDLHVMYSGHVDSWYYGAMDNATTNAAQVEVVRIAAKNRSRLKHNLRAVFFSGHSHGRYAGSSWYADNFREDLSKNCLVNINSDSIGAIGANKLTHSMIMSENMALAKQIIREQTGIEFIGQRCERKADQSFGLIGISSAFASFSRQFKAEPTGNDLGWWWHTPEDTIDKIDSSNLLRDAKIISEFVFTTLCSEKILADYEDTAREIVKILAEYSEKAKKQFDLSRSLIIANKLLTIITQIYYLEEVDVEKYNDFVLSLGRLLVVINYSSGYIYANDHLDNTPMPSLSLINSLIKASPQSDEEKMIIVELTQKQNFVIDNLNRALNLSNDFFDNYRSK